MLERVTFLPSTRTFLTGCPALGLEERSSVEVLGAEFDPRRETRRKDEPDYPNKNIVFSVSVTDVINPKERRIARIVVRPKGRTPQEIFEAIRACRGPNIGRITEFPRCPLLELIPSEKPRRGL